MRISACAASSAAYNGSEERGDRPCREPRREGEMAPLEKALSGEMTPELGDRSLF